MINLYGDKGLISPYYKNVYRAVFNDDFRFITLKGGRFSAKGDTVYTLLLIKLSQFQGEGRIFVPVQRNIKTGVLKQVIKVAKRINLPCLVNMSDHSITLSNGSKIYFSGLDASKSTVNSDLSKGSDSELECGILFCIFDELGALNSFERVDDIIDTFIRQENCTFFEISNPPQNKASSLIKRYADQEKNSDYLVMHSTVFDIPKSWVNEQQIKQIKNYKENNEIRYKHSILGLSVGVDGLAFEIDESIWTDLKGDVYQQFFIQTDEGTLNATTFSLFGLTFSGQLHYISNYYHSSKEDGIKKSPSTYAFEFKKWYDDLGVDVKMIVTDGLAFSEELKKLGFFTKSIGSLKNRSLSYQLLDKLVSEKNFKIINRAENIMLYDQMANAIIEYDKMDKPIVSKKGESTKNNKLHTHALDTCLYMCLRLKKEILRGQKW